MPKQQSLETLNVGIVGAAGRGASFESALGAYPGAKLLAICDLREDQLLAAKEELGAVEVYVDYQQMLDRSSIDAVVIGTPMPFHAAQSTAALERGIHVLSEVTAGVSLEECQTLVEAANRSPAIYMMAENYTYRKPNVLVKALVDRGLFGELYYAEGEYLHELKQHNEVTPWRRRWQTGIDGVTYGTHSLGPILDWMEGDRVERVCCEGSGHHYRDPRGDLYENQDSCVMLCKTRHGALIKIRVDMISERPHAMTNYTLQGTRGCYESARARGEHGRIWLAEVCEDDNKWMNLDELEEDYLPDIWRKPTEETLKSGHGGGDFLEVQDFLNSIINGTPCPIGIHEAMDMTLPGLMSQESIRDSGSWKVVPDSRDW